jgi:2'-5' RNA ligase
VDVEQTIRQYLPDIIHMSLATSKGSQPWVCEVHFAYDDDLNLYYRSLITRHHSEEIAQNPNVAGNIVVQRVLGSPGRGVYFEGAAKLLQVIDDMHPAFTNLSKRLGIGESTLEEARRSDGHHFYQVTVTDFYFFDQSGKQHLARPQAERNLGSLMAHKYVIVHMIETGAYPDQFPFHRWPLHLTLLANFTLPVDVDLLIKRLEVLAARVRPLDIRLGAEAMFGAAGNVVVRLAEVSPGLQELHLSLIAVGSELGLTYDGVQFMGAAFRPHVTMRGRRVPRGYAFKLANMSLVDLAPDDNPRRRRVIKTIEFSAG